MDEPTGPDVLLGPLLGDPRTDSPRDFESLFRIEFARVARTVHHIVGDRRQADEVTQDARAGALMTLLAASSPPR